MFDILTQFSRWLELEQQLCQHKHRQDIGALTRGGAVARGRGRVRRRMPTRGRGQTPGLSRNRAVTPPPTDEVVREGKEGENEQVQDKEVPPQPTQR